MKNIRWGNVPIPEGHLIFLAAGLTLGRFRPLPLFATFWPAALLGGLLLLAGIVRAYRAVASVNAIDVGTPTHLIDTGPYARSRNPMYVAWTLIYVGVGLLANTAWLLLLLPPLVLFTHYFVVLPEERHLAQQFGAAYAAYSARVRRYL